MNTSELNFDKDGLIYDVKIKEQEEMIMLSWYYDLDITLVKNNSENIVNFINNSQIWYDKVKELIYEKTKDNNAYLTIVYILELGQNSVFGLSFESDFDSEHGIGLKISDGSHEILDFGQADVAFC